MIKTANLTSKHFSALITPDIISICEPLKALDITYFLYSRIFKDKSVYTLTTHWDAYYEHCKNEYAISPPITQKITTSKFHYLPFINSNDSGYNNLEIYRNAFNLDYPIYFVEAHETYVDLYAYGSWANNSNIINYYLNNIDVLEKFKFYFKDKAAKLINKSTNNKLILPDHMVAPFASLKNNTDPTVYHQNILQQIKPNHYILEINNRTISISKREFDVLKTIAYGNSIKESAVKNLLSPRTVESYLESIKNKIGLSKKTELIKILMDSNLL